MAAQELRDFSDIVDYCLESLGLQSTDTTSKNRIKRIINSIYLDEVVPFKRWHWLKGHVQREHKPYYGSGTCTVTPDSTTVTLSSAPSVASGSRAGYKFAVNGFSEIYEVSTHTAGSATLVLTSPYTGSVSTTAAFKIWTEDINLPTDARETTEIWHDFMNENMEAVGNDEFRKRQAVDRKYENRPYCYTTYDYNSDTAVESARYRLVKIYPAIYPNSTTLKIDYVKEATALDLDADEPLMPIEDRIVLVYGALSVAWRTMMRNPEEAQINFDLFQRKLNRMGGKIEDGFDKPQLHPDSGYMLSKRGPRFRGFSRRAGTSASSGGSSYTSPNYIVNAQIGAGNTLVANLAVDSGITIDGRDISADATLFDAHIAASANVHGIGSTASVVGTDTAQALSNKTINADANTITNIENADIKAAAGIAYSKLTLTGSVVNADISATAAIAYSKLNLATSIVNADISATAAIAYSKLNLATSIVNADIAAGAAIAYSKLNLATSIVNADIAAGAAIAYSKLNLTGTIVSGDLAGSIDATKIADGTVTSTEFQYINTLSSNAQTQLNAKIPKSLLTTAGDMIYASATDTPVRLPIGSSGQVIKQVGGVPTWATFSGGINYLSSNPDAESDTTGWTLYEDAAATTPVDGTGVATSNEITWTRTTSAPLRGSGSFLLTKDAADRQGEGVGFAFTIDDADKFKVLTCSGDYEIASGTYATGDLAFYFVDVTNGTVIQPSGYQLQNVGIESKFIVQFQTTSSTSYRLVIHVASTSASAYTVKFDNFIVGPQVVQYGAPVADLGTETWTDNQANATTSVQVYRNGSWVKVVGKTTFTGVVSGATSVTIPTGYTPDTTTYASPTTSDPYPLGTIYHNDPGSTVTYGTIDYATAGELRFLVDVSSGSYGSGTNTTNLIPHTWASGDVMKWTAEWKVGAWSSSVQMSNDTDTRVVTCQVIGDAASASSGNPIIFPTVNWDSHGGYNASTGRYTVPVPGYYKMFGALNSANTAVGFNIYKNAVSIAMSIGFTDSNGECVFAGVVSCVAGDVIDIRPGATLDAGAGSCLNIERLSGPSAIAASEKIAARYTTTAGQSIATSTVTIVDYGTKTLDTHGAVTTGASWKFTSPRSDYYRVSANTTFNSAWAGQIIMYVYKNGALYSQNSQTSNTTVSPGTVTDLVQLNAGDYIDVRVWHAQGGAQVLWTSAATNNVAIESM